MDACTPTYISPEADSNLALEYRRVMRVFRTKMQASNCRSGCKLIANFNVEEFHLLRK